VSEQRCRTGAGENSIHRCKYYYIFPCRWSSISPIIHTYPYIYVLRARDVGSRPDESEKGQRPYAIRSLTKSNTTMPTHIKLTGQQYYALRKPCPPGSRYNGTAAHEKGTVPINIFLYLISNFLSSLTLLNYKIPLSSSPSTNILLQITSSPLESTFRLNPPPTLRPP
jgi:hypothetical protein